MYLGFKYHPILVLFPEISLPMRIVRKNWRQTNEPPLFEDYWPRDILLWNHTKQLKVLNDDRIDVFPGIAPWDRNGFWRRYAEILREKPSGYPVTAYLNAQEADNGLIALQYWFFYPYNDAKTVHEGDWEHCIVYLNAKEEPIAMGYAAHRYGFRLPWRLTEHRGNHPLVYVAQGSHASYPYGPGQLETFLDFAGTRFFSGKIPGTKDFIDHVASAKLPDYSSYYGVEVNPSIKLGTWGFKGHWGTIGLHGLVQKLIPSLLKKHIYSWGGYETPTTPRSRPNWDDPFAWLDEKCVEPVFTKPWLELIDQPEVAVVAEVLASPALKLDTIVTDAS